MSALINPYGAPARVVEAVMTGTTTAVVSPRLLEELAAVLARPKFRRWIRIEDAVAFVNALEASAELRPDPARSPKQSVRDLGDDYLVVLAEEVKAVIVSGDADLLSAALDPAAITPRAFVELGCEGS